MKKMACWSIGLYTPHYKFVEVSFLKNHKYSRHTIYEMEDDIPCAVLKGIRVSVAEIFKLSN